MILFSEPIPVEIVNQGSSIFSAPNVISIVSLLVSFSAAWYQWRSNGPRVNIWYSIYGPHVIPDGDRTYPKATLTIHVANKGRTETEVVTTDKVINKKLPKDIAKIIQGWIDQCSESEDKD